MAQLVKLLDYVSRYENDLSRYPTQFVRLKSSQWDRMKLQWENGMDLSEWQRESGEEEAQREESRWFSPILRVFGSKKDSATDQEEHASEQQEEREADSFGFNPNIIYNPKNVEQLRKLYVDQLFHFQLKWASSTLMEHSKLDEQFMRDSLLRSFTQLLPDSYLLFYYPILKLKKAPVELDILIMTPLECICVTVLEKEEVAAFIGNSDRFWIKKYGDRESKVLNPMIGLQRMEKIISGIFSANDIEFPIRKVILSRNGYIDYPGVPYDTKIVDRRSYDEWFANLRKVSVPMKHNQFKAAQAILDNGQTTASSIYFAPEQENNDIIE